MSPPNEFDIQQAIAAFAAGGAILFFAFRRLSETAALAPPDPWGPEVDEAVRARDAIPVCPNCLFPQEDRPSFCPHCAYPSGDFVTLNPYLQIFAVGEVLRRGVIGPPERGFFRTVGFVIYSATEYAFFAPLYWFWMLRKSAGKPICQSRRPELEFEEPD